MIKVLIADDQELIRQSLQIVLNACEDIEVVATARNGREVLSAVRRTSPDVVLMDIRMPEMDGIQCTQILKENDHSLRILVLTTFDDDQFVYQALKHRLVRIARPVMYDEKNVVDVCYEVLVINKKSNETKMINETHHMRYFFRPELEFYLKNAGFELVDNLDCMTLGKTGYDSWTSYFVAKAV